MKKLFACRKGDTFTEKILVEARVDRNRCGSLSIHAFNTLKIDSKPSGEEVEFTVKGGKWWIGGLERRGYKPKDEEPYNRRGVDYIPAPFNRLNIIRTSAQGRFFSLRQAHNVGEAYSETHEKQTPAVILDNREELSKHLEKVLGMMGVPKKDIPRVKEDIFSKL